jgi:hypothetical protein
MLRHKNTVSGYHWKWYIMWLDFFVTAFHPDLVWDGDAKQNSFKKICILNLNTLLRQSTSLACNLRQTQVSTRRRHNNLSTTQFWLGNRFFHAFHGAPEQSLGRLRCKTKNRLAQNQVHWGIVGYMFEVQSMTRRCVKSPCQILRWLSASLAFFFQDPATEMAPFYGEFESA